MELGGAVEVGHREVDEPVRRCGRAGGQGHHPPVEPPAVLEAPEGLRLGRDLVGLPPEQPAVEPGGGVRVGCLALVGAGPSLGVRIRPPVVGVIIYWLFADRAKHNSGAGYEPIA